MIIYKTTLKLNNEFKITKYTKTKPNKSDITKEIMRAWHNYCDGFELSEEEFEDFKNSIKYKTKEVIVL